MDKRIMVVVSDMHIGSTVGLCTPYVNLDDGGTYFASKKQSALWEAWTEMWKQVKPLAQPSAFGPKIPVYVMLNGDLVETDSKGRSDQVITRNASTIMEATLNALQPALEVADKVWVVRGTEAHVGNSAKFEEAIANDLDITVKASESVSSHWHVRADIAGVRFDISHHVNMGSLPHTEKNAANALAYQIMWEIMEYQEPRYPDIAVRGHV